MTGPAGSLKKAKEKNNYELDKGIEFLSFLQGLRIREGGYKEKDWTNDTTYTKV